MVTNSKRNTLKCRTVAARRARFLRLLHEHGGNITTAAAATPWRRTSVYELINRDPKFAARVEKAIKSGAKALEDEAHRRAMAQSDNLLMFLLKGRMREKYGDRSVVDANVSTSAPVQFYLPDNGRDSEAAD